MQIPKAIKKADIETLTLVKHILEWSLKCDCLPQVMLITVEKPSRF